MGITRRSRLSGDDLRYTERKERRGSGKGGSSGLVYADVDAVRYGGDLAKGGYCGLSYRAGLYTGIATYPVEPESGQDAMPVLFDLLKNEPHPAVRAVLGHFFSCIFTPIWTGTGEWDGSS